MITSVTAEFNPFHKGHESLMKFAGGAGDSGGVVVILSSNFTQRGLPSMTDKFARACTALKGGGDLVIELPFLYACSAGENFAEGACETAGRLGFVDRVVFGAEDAEFDAEGLAEAMMSREYGEILRGEMRKGASYAKASGISAERIFEGGGEFLSRPNNTLAVSYIKSIKRNGYGMRAEAFKREGDITSGMIREDTEKYGGYMPEYSYELVKKLSEEGRISEWERLWPLFEGLMIRSGREELRGIYGVDEGIEGMMMKRWRGAGGMEEFVGRCVCARYTRAHIRRCMVYMLLGLRREDVKKALNKGVPYARVLAFNEKGREILRRYRKSSGIKMITGLKYAEGWEGRYFAETERRAEMLYEMTLGERGVAIPYSLYPSPCYLT